MAPRRHPTPALWALALGYFSFGTTSLATVALSAPIGSTLHAPPSRMGLLVSAFALAFAVTAPLAPMLLGRIPRRALLVTGLLVMIAGGAASALAPSYAVLTAGRVLAALGGAVFVPAASSTGSAIVPQERRTRALATVFAGMTAATVLGVPLCALAGDAVGWRPTLASVAALPLLALAAVSLTLPPVRADAPATRAAMRATITARGVPSAIGTTLAFMGAQFTLYSVVGDYLTDRFHTSAHGVAAALLVFGLAGIAGNALAPRVHERIGGPATVTTALAALAATFTAFLIIPTHLPWVVVLFGVWGAASQLFMAPQQARLVALTPHHRTMVLALNASALYIGISAGSLLGSAVLAMAGAAALPAATLIPLAAATLTHHRSTHTTRSTPPVRQGRQDHGEHPAPADRQH
ncbi:MFS transporter [Streptomyces sp. NPDC001781]